MALDPKLTAQLKKDLKEINEIYRKIGQEPLTLDFDSAGVDDIKLVRDYLSEARTFVEDLDEGFGGMVNSVNAIVKEWNSGFASPTKEATKSFGKLKGIAEKLSDDFKGISDLRGKELKTLYKSAKIEAERLKNLQAELENKKKQLKAGEKLSDEEETLLGQLKEGYQVQKEILDGAEKRLGQEQKIQKTIGLTGAAFRGISGTLSKIGIDSEQISSINEDMRETAKNTGSSYAVLGSALGGIKSGLKDAISDPLVQLTFFIKTFKTLGQIGLATSDQTAEITRNLGLSTDQANDFREQMQRLSPKKKQKTCIHIRKYEYMG